MLATDEKIARFCVAERVVHWLAALCFLYAALTGLAMWSHKLFWLAGVFGGGPTTRFTHPWAGILFAVVLGIMFRRWASHMRLDDDDRQWLRNSHQYAVHREEGLPDSGRFNAGQKMLFWTQSGLALLLLATGIVLWFPMEMPRALRLIAVALHPLAAIGAIGAIIVHIYMGTAAVPEAFRGMIQGWVRPAWAASHHPKWYRETRRQSGR